MSDELVRKIRGENYLLEIQLHTKDKWYVDATKRIISFVKDAYRTLEPSHFNGDLIITYNRNDKEIIPLSSGDNYYDSSLIPSDFNNIVFQIFTDEDRLPKLWKDCDESDVKNIYEEDDNIITYVFRGNENKEEFIVNGHVVNIKNQFSCPSIFALQYHYLQEALNEYKSSHIRNVSCEHFRKCWHDSKYIYFKNKPEECMQISLSEFLKNRVRGVNIIREYNLDASKPVDVHVSWREANRAALIEVKWLGQSINSSGQLGTSYTNARGNDGMEQIKEYIDLSTRDTPTLICKGYLVVIDGRRAKIGTNIVAQIARADGYHYSDRELTIKEEFQYWQSFPNLEIPIRMFVEAICER